VKTVTGADGIHHLYGRRLDFNCPRLFMPRLSALDPARDDHNTCARLDQRLGLSRTVATAVQKFKVDIRHPHDVGGGDKRIHPIDVAGLILHQIRPAVRIKGDGDGASCIPDERERLGCPPFIGERR